MKQVFRTPKAEEDLINIWNYLAENFSEDRAESYLLKLEQQIELLLNQPYMGRNAEELMTGLRRFPFQKHVVFYRLIDEGLEIIRVMHGAQDIESEFKG